MKQVSTIRSHLVWYQWLEIVQRVAGLQRGGSNSGEVSSTFGHANENFSVFLNRIRNQFRKN